jgi:integrase
MDAKSRVKIESIRGNLRLRSAHEGRRPTMYLGLYDSPVARTVAEGRASEIEADLATGNYDPNLKKYRRDADREVDGGLTLVALFNAFFQYRAKKFPGDTQQRYQSVLRKLEGFFGMRI